MALALTAPHIPGAAVFASVIAGLATPPIKSTLRSLWPQLFEEGASRNSAYALDLAIREVAFIAGLLLTAAGILLVGAGERCRHGSHRHCRNRGICWMARFRQKAFSGKHGHP